MGGPSNLQTQILCFTNENINPAEGKLVGTEMQPPNSFPGISGKEERENAPGWVGPVR